MRKGKINTLDKKTLEDLVRKHISLSAILRELNLHTSSGNFRNLKKKLNVEKINFQHIMEGPGYDTKKIHSFKKIIPIDQILIEESTFNPTHLKKRLIRENLLKESCMKCGLGNTWCNEPISLQLDHINGIHNDNRLGNLRLLCPNCHSQTSTYAARNKQPKIKTLPKQSARKTKINWPTNDELLLMLSTSSYSELGRILGVSDNAIRKRLAKH